MRKKIRSLFNAEPQFIQLWRGPHRGLSHWMGAIGGVKREHWVVRSHTGIQAGPGCLAWERGTNSNSSFGRRRISLEHTASRERHGKIQ